MVQISQKEADYIKEVVNQIFDVIEQSEGNDFSFDEKEIKKKTGIINQIILRRQKVGVIKF